MRKVQSIRSLWWPHPPPSMKDLLSAGESSGHGRCSAARQQQQGRWLWWQWLLSCQLYIFFRSLSSANHLQCPRICPHTLADSGCWSRDEWSCGRCRGQEGQQSQGARSNLTFCPSCLQSVAWQPKPPRRCALPSTVTHQHRHSVALVCP